MKNRNFANQLLEKMASIETNINSIEITENFINLDKVIASKAPKLQKKLPRFVIRYLTKLLHVNELNYAIYKYRNLFGSDFANAILSDILSVQIKVTNPQYISTEGNPIFVSNHPLGGIDGMALISEIGKVRNDILFPVNDFLLYLPGLRPVFIPINKVGLNTQNRSALEEAFKGNNALLFFPAGLCSRKQNGEIKDLPWKKTFIKKSIQYKRDIIPIFFDAKNSNCFYNIANWRKRLGIKFNIEMILLPDEMYRQKGKVFHLIFGKPIAHSTFNSSKTHEEWASLIQEHTYRLKENPDIEFKIS